MDENCNFLIADPLLCGSEVKMSDYDLHLSNDICIQNGGYIYFLAAEAMKIVSSSVINFTTSASSPPPMKQRPANPDAT